MLVGKPAPNFTASALDQGNFMKVSLSDYIGSWIVLLFYSGDFTYV